MNKTTFTIESVHGVKQTIVLGPTIQIATANVSQEGRVGSEPGQSTAKASSTAARR